MLNLPESIFSGTKIFDLLVSGRVYFSRHAAFASKFCWEKHAAFCFTKDPYASFPVHGGGKPSKIAEWRWAVFFCFHRFLKEQKFDFQLHYKYLFLSF